MTIAAPNTLPTRRWWKWISRRKFLRDDKWIWHDFRLYVGDVLFARHVWVGSIFSWLMWHLWVSPRRLNFGIPLSLRKTFLFTRDRGEMRKRPAFSFDSSSPFQLPRCFWLMSLSSFHGQVRCSFRSLPLLAGAYQISCRDRNAAVVIYFFLFYSFLIPARGIRTDSASPFPLFFLPRSPSGLRINRSLLARATAGYRPFVTVELPQFCCERGKEKKNNWKGGNVSPLKILVIFHVLSPPPFSLSPLSHSLTHTRKFSSRCCFSLSFGFCFCQTQTPPLHPSARVLSVFGGPAVKILAPKPTPIYETCDFSWRVWRKWGSSGFLKGDSRARESDCV